jgi:hypothetical protein
MLYQVMSGIIRLFLVRSPYIRLIHVRPYVRFFRIVGVNIRVFMLGQFRSGYIGLGRLSQFMSSRVN